MHRQDSDEELSEGDEEILNAPRPVHLRDQFSIANENTNITMNRPESQIINVLDTEFTEAINDVWRDQRVDKNKYLKSFGSYVNFDNFKYMQLENERFQLICVPVFILVDPSVTPLKRVAEQLKKENLNARINVQLDEKNKNRTHSNFITFNPKPSNPFYFKIKALPPYGKDKEADVLIDKLFQFHLEAIDGLEKFACYIFHWASARRILDEKYLPIGALKILIILFLTYNNIPNLIEMYMKVYQAELDKADEYIDIGPKGTYKANAEVINNLPNCILQERKGFYLKSENKFDLKYIVRKIPFPITASEIGKMMAPFRSRNSDTFAKTSVGKWVWEFFKWCQRVNLSPKSEIIIDLRVKERVSCIAQSATPTLDIIHPVLDYNITSHLRKDQEALEAVCKEFKKAYDHVITGDMEEISLIDQKYVQ